MKLIPLNYLKVCIKGLLSKGSDYNVTPLQSELVADYLVDNLLEGGSKHKELQSLVDGLLKQLPGEIDNSSLIKFIDDNLIPWWMHKG